MIFIRIHTIIAIFKNEKSIKIDPSVLEKIENNFAVSKITHFTNIKFRDVIIN